MIVTNYEEIVFYTDNKEIISQARKRLVWDDEEQYEIWYALTNDGQAINKRLINGFLEEIIKCVNMDTGEGYLFHPETLEALDINENV